HATLRPGFLVLLPNHRGVPAPLTARMDFSRYSAPDDSWASAPTPGQDYPPGTTSTTLASRFLAFVDDPRFPCVGSKVALARDAIEVAEFADLSDPADDRRLLDGLSAFGA